jgi:hypothetical protein
MFLQVPSPVSHVHEVAVANSFSRTVRWETGQRSGRLGVSSFDRKCYRTRRRRIAGDDVPDRLERKYQAIADLAAK